MRKSTPAFTLSLVVCVIMIFGGASSLYAFLDYTPGENAFLNENSYTTKETNLNSLTSELSKEELNYSVSCIDLVNMSLDDNCEVVITASAIIREEIDPVNLEVIIEDDEGVILSNPITIAHINTLLKVTVRNTLTGAACWGNVWIEDKSPPTFECPPDTVVSCYFHEPLPLPEAFDNCDPDAYVKIISDEIVNVTCFEIDTISAIRTVIYQAFDKYGNKSDSCVQIIEYRRLTVGEIVFPPHYDSLDGNRPYLACDDRPIWDLNNNNYPDPWVDLNKNGKLDPGEIETDVPRTIEGYPIIPNKAYCEIESTYKDIVLDICENSYKVIREWKILDWCTSEIRSEYQIIKVLDDEGPIVSCPPLDSLYADPWTCTADYKVPHPPLILDCSSTTYTVEYKEGNPLGSLPGDDVPWVDDKVELILDDEGQFSCYIIRDLALGRTWVRYTITDACGNSTQCTTEVDVFDKSEPIAVCLEYTNVPLDESGYAKVFAASLDNGSYDQCSEVFFQVRRKGAPADTMCYGKDPNDWADFVAFCCEDVGKYIQVEFRVWDDADQDGVFGSEGDFYSVCWVNVHVQNKFSPTLNIPPDTTLHCIEDFNDLEITGTATAFGICGPLEPTYINSGSVDACGEGIISRIWRVTEGEFTITKIQRITITNLFPFDGDKDIVWPRDTTLFGCLRDDTDPENLPEGYDFPEYESDDCTTLAISYKDQVLSSVEDVCFKIIRTWTLIDWCKYEDSNRREGLWSHIQIIKVNETEPPVINMTNDITVCTQSQDCEGFIELVNTAEDCTPLKDQKWTYVIDPFNDGEGLFIHGNSNNASGVYPVGTHKITWKVKDQCGNESTTMHLFTIQDCKKPTPYCITEITTVIMPSTGNIEIWAVDFDLGSEDNCPGTLKFTFNGMFPVASLINQMHFFKGFGLVATEAEYMNGQAQKWLPSSSSSAIFGTCDDVGLIDLEMWVWDVQGNGDFCNIRLNLQSNTGCEDEASSRVSGAIVTADQQKVNNTEVSLLDMTGGKKSFYLTSDDGTYEFTEMVSNKDYEITASKDDDYSKGVSTLDILLIQRHILGIQRLDDPYKMIAADVNNSKTITATDILQMRKLILGLFTEFPGSPSWKFIDAGYEFSDPDKPWDYQESIVLQDVSGQMEGNNFIAVKVGDVDRSYSVNLRNQPLGYRSSQPLAFNLENNRFRRGEEVTMTFSMENSESLAGFQTTITFDPGMLEFNTFYNEGLAIEESNFNTNHVNEGMLAVSWNNGTGEVPLQSETLFTLVFRALEDGAVSNSIWLSDHITSTEAYNSDLRPTQLDLLFIEEEAAGVLLHQNRPNPFMDHTVISFVLPAPAPASISIFDVSGRLVHRVYGDFPGGQTDIQINAQEIQANGILYYQLETGGLTTSRKMIKVNK